MPQRKGKVMKGSLSGSYRPESVNREARTVEVVFTTGQAGERYNWDLGRYIEELDVTSKSVRTDRLDKGLSVIDSHNTYRGVNGVYGVTESYEIKNGQIVGTVRFANDEESDKVFNKVADGILRHVSLGYRVHKYEHTKATGDNKLDTLRAVDWTPLELSFVPVSFETTNGVRSEQNEETYDVEIEVREMPKEVIEEQSRSEQTPAAPAAPAAPVLNVRDYTETAKTAGLDVEFALRAIDAGQDINEFRAAVISEMGRISQENVPKVFLGEERQDHSETERQDAENYLLHRSGFTGVELDAGSRQFSGMTLLEMAKDVAGAKASEMRGMSKQAQAARAFHSSSDFPLLLENVMNKSLQRGYDEVQRTFVGLGAKTSVNDFRAKHTYKMGDAPSLKKLGEHGEYQSGTFSESKESYAIETFARKIGFTRKMLINDDMSALDRFPRLFGQAGSRLESDMVWGLLLNYDFDKNAAANFKMADGKHLFHADHKNVLTGAGSALSKASLSELRKLGRKMKTLDGNFMNIMYNTLVLPEELETPAEEILMNNILANVTGETNSFKGKFDFRIEPRLAVVSQTAWFAFTNMIDSFEYAYLAGEEGMYTETNQSTNVDGLEILVRKDFGVGFCDERGAARSNGA